MVHKLVNLSLDAYNALKKAKKKDESFSKVVLRNFGSKNKDSWGAFGILSEEKADEWKRNISEIRRHTKVRTW